MAVALLAAAAGFTWLRSGDAVAASPCDAFTTGELSEVVGQSMGDGRVTGGTTACRYLPTGGRGPTVLVSVEEASGESSMATALAAAEAAGASTEPLFNGGFAASSTDGTTHSAEVVANGKRYRVLLENAQNSRALAVHLLSLVGSSS